MKCKNECDGEAKEDDFTKNKNFEFKHAPRNLFFAVSYAFLFSFLDILYPCFQPSMHSNGISRGHNGDSRRSSMVDATGRFCSQPMSGSPEVSYFILKLL